MKIRPLASLFLGAFATFGSVPEGALAQARVPTQPPFGAIGTYWCEVQSGEVVYAPQRCTVARTRAGALLFEKSGGSQRFSGVLRLMPNQNVRFVGLFFCPRGACDETVDTTVDLVGGTWTMSLPHGQVVNISKVRQTRCGDAFGCGASR